MSKRPTYISPSALSQYEDNKEMYYMKYCSGIPREPQTKQMAVGSAFDAYIKGYLHHALLGGDVFEELFEKQVESHNRDAARVIGKYVFDVYLKCGAAADMLVELDSRIGIPRFEFELLGTTPDGKVPLSGRPDIFFTNRFGAKILLDWKVNGYYSKMSPCKGYIKVRDGWTPSEAPPSRNIGMHKDCSLGIRDGVAVNINHNLEASDPKWATQLAIYGWILGEEVGSGMICGIDQIVGTAKYINDCKDHLLRVASFRSVVGVDFQTQLIARLEEMWGRVSGDHFWTELSKEESDVKCATLERQARALTSNDGLTQGGLSLEGIV